MNRFASKMADWQRKLPLVESFLTLFDEQKGCDVMFSIDSMTIGAHKAFLQARSNILYEWAQDWTPTHKPVVISEISYDIFRAVLRYIYSDQVEITDNNVFDFLFAAKCFEMDHLEKHCTEHTMEYLGEENVCEYMKQALEFNALALKTECCKVFTENTKEILVSSEFQSLPQQAVSSFLDTDEINVLEIDLFEAVNKWMVQQCKDREIPKKGTNMRKVIGDALFKIRFPTMTVWDFSNEVTSIEGLLTDVEIAQTFKKISAFKNGAVNCPFSSRFRCVNGVSQDANMTTQCKLSSQGVIVQGGTWRSLATALDNWVCSSYDLDRKSFQIVLQCCADLRNSSSSGSVVKANIGKESKDGCSAAFKEWNVASPNSSKNMQAAMSKVAALHEVLANLK